MFGLLLSSAIGILIFFLASGMFGPQRVNGVFSRIADESMTGAFPRVADDLEGGTPTTRYSNSKFGISAWLPGTNWDPPGKLSIGNGEYVWRTDGSAHFSFSVHPLSFSPSEWVQTRLEDPMIKENSAQTTDDVMYKGFHAIKLEAIVDYGTEPLWHEIFYSFCANNVTYVVEAGTTVEVWDKGGRELVTRVLNSVRIAAKTTPPDV
jgi:hypothetical protein